VRRSAQEFRDLGPQAVLVEAVQGIVMSTVPVGPVLRLADAKA
jgi:hypothetical protein